jgi:hypothetical protein
MDKTAEVKSMDLNLGFKAFMDWDAPMKTLEFDDKVKQVLERACRDEFSLENQLKEAKKMNN